VLSVSGESPKTDHPLIKEHVDTGIDARILRALGEDEL